MSNLKRFDDVMANARCISEGSVFKTEDGKWSYRMHLTILPMDDVLTSESEKTFESAVEAAQALYKNYGSDGWPSDMW